MKEKQAYKNLGTSGQKFQKILFMASSCTYYVPKCGSTRLCDGNCSVQSADRRTDVRTDGRTDKSLKTEGPMILLIDIFYLKTVIIGGPITRSPVETLYDIGHWPLFILD